MSVLTPKEAASLANKAYEIRTDAAWNDLLFALSKTKDPSLVGFDKNPSRVEGKSGWGQSSGFVYLANGSGAHAGESLVSIRGTASLADALTDARVSFAQSPAGYVAHRGFATAFESIKLPVDTYLKKSGGTANQIHVVGHSLGGAMACLTAEYLTLRGHKVKLYTFGCPRVGDSRYADVLDNLIGIQNIYRVYHEADPVSMIPIYPFVPVSNSNIGYRMPWNGGVISGHLGKAHFMDNYIESIGNSNWDGLPSAPEGDVFSSIEAWLEQAAISGGGIKAFCCSSLRQIMKALKWVLSAICAAGAATLQLAFSGAVSIVDVLAYILQKGCLVGVKIAGYVKGILMAILKFLGKTVDSAIDITVEFIRFIFGLFFGFLSNAASTALKSLP